MAELNTPLINELLRQVSQHPEFETWRQKGKHPTSGVKELCEPLKTDPRLIGQPARFYTSATTLVNYIYKSWFALMKRSQYQLEGKTLWLEMLRSDHSECGHYFGNTDINLSTRSNNLANDNITIPGFANQLQSCCAFQSVP